MNHQQLPIEQAKLNALTEKDFTVTAGAGSEQLHYKDIAHMAVAQLPGNHSRPQTIIDLMLEQAETPRRLRLTLDSTNPRHLVPASPSTDMALMAVIHTLHRESGATLLPNEQVLRNGPQVFEDLATFEEQAYQHRST